MSFHIFFKIQKTLKIEFQEILTEHKTYHGSLYIAKMQLNLKFVVFMFLLRNSSNNVKNHKFQCNTFILIFLTDLFIISDFFININMIRSRKLYYT